MPTKRERLVIINRSFWPIYPVIGEALLRFAEQHAAQHEISVILQDHVGIRKKLNAHQRGKGVNFYPCKAFSISGSGIFTRVLDALFFMVWVFFILIWKRPTKIYVSTDPPILVPFLVMVYCRFFGGNYIYHLQDIHPEAANIVVKVRPWLFNFLKKADSISMRNAKNIITITPQMANEIRFRSGFKGRCCILPNPSVDFGEVNLKNKKKPGFVFCGNAGRLQRIPLLISSIDFYLQQGGNLKFVFAGGGVYSNDLKNLSEKYKFNVDYYGFVSPEKAAKLNCEYEWALLPIEDEVTKYAFPSKSSSYVFSNAKILAICSNTTSVAQWVVKKNIGCVVAPNIDDIVDFFFQVERNEISDDIFDMERKSLKDELNFDVFVKKLSLIIFENEK